MNNTSEGIIPTFLIGAIIAGLAGVLAAALLWSVGGWSFMQGAFVGFVVFAIAAAIIAWVMRPLPAPGEVSPVAAPKPASPPPAAAPQKAAAPAPAPAAAPAEDAAVVKPSAPLAGEAELAARKGSWTYEGGGAPAPKAVASSAPAADDAAAPQLFTSPQGEADNLKLISGVGPKLEATLNELGIWHFSQIAAWGPNDIAWVDARLRFKGRIERDDWMAQASTLAAGGETEFSKKKK